MEAYIERYSWRKNNLKKIAKELEEKGAPISLVLETEEDGIKGPREIFSTEILDEYKKYRIKHIEVLYKNFYAILFPDESSIYLRGLPEQLNKKEGKIIETIIKNYPRQYFRRKFMVNLLKVFTGALVVDLVLSLL